MNDIGFIGASRDTGMARIALAACHGGMDGVRFNSYRFLVLCYLLKENRYMTTESNDLKTVSNVSLLSLVLGKRAAKRLYRGSLVELFLDGRLAPAYLERMSACRELVRRWMMEELRHGPVLGDPKGVRDYLRVHYAGYEREVLSVLFLDNRHRLLACEEMFQGTIDGATVHPREVVKRALSHNAAAVILAHNHPSGVAEPSQADELITRRIKDALAIVDIRCLDHLVIAGTATVSLAERGVL
jgi:DNA repair protein RadC